MTFNELSLYPVRDGKLLKDFYFGITRVALWGTDLRTRLITGSSVREGTAGLKRQMAKSWFRKVRRVWRDEVQAGKVDEKRLIMNWVGEVSGVGG